MNGHQTLHSQNDVVVYKKNGIEIMNDQSKRPSILISKIDLLCSPLPTKISFLQMGHQI